MAAEVVGLGHLVLEGLELGLEPDGKLLHPGLRAGRLREVYHLGALQDCQVRRLAGRLDQPGEHRSRPTAQRPGGQAAEADQSGPERVPAVGVLAHVTGRGERAGRI